MLLPYSRARALLRPGDLLLFRRRGLIALAGRGIHSHAAMVDFWDDLPFCIEVREFRGGRAVTLESQVRRCPGRIDVFRPLPTPDFHPEIAAKAMRAYCGCDYGWRNVVHTALLHVPFFRLWHRPDVDDRSTNPHPPFCSEAVAACYRAAGLDPVPRLADRYTEPADLSRSAAFRYHFTLAGC